ncbi:pyocin knob domain-containing S74 family peptidase [Superficieibacter sp.]|uniref:pyocin knob domain-containing S74 family peptidase n=1 Tax=Superficieibacter sp. TaxID=2303322 RepID=UPI0028A5B99B|nr:pyocin knob domain-containing S74 family peptidase [Superficieibacter sp.]
MANISDDLAAALTKILSQAQLDIQNQDKLFNGNGDVTITRADGSTFNAATWAKMMAATTGTLKQNGSLGTLDLDSVNGSQEGFWYQVASANATAARHYPETQYGAGALIVISDRANHANSCSQMYFMYSGNNIYVRNGATASSGTVTWSAWQKLAYTSDPEFTGKVVMPSAMHLKKDKVILKAGDDNTCIFTIGGSTDICLFNGDGIYNNGRNDAVRGYASRRGTGNSSTLTGNLWALGWATQTGMTLYVDGSTIGSIQTASNSDREMKKNIKYLARKEREAALAEVMKWMIATFRYKARGDGLIPESGDKLGWIANDLIEVSPECVEGEGLKEGEELDPLKAYSLDTVAMMAKMTLAMQAQQEIINDLQTTVNQLKEKLISE